MSIFDEARSISVMMKMRRMTQSQTAKMLGVSQSYVANKLRLLNLDEKLQKRICEANLTERHARALLRLTAEGREAALEEIIERKMTVAEAEALVDFLHIKDISETVGQSDRLRSVGYFMDETKKTLSALRSLGVFATQKVSYYGSQIMITICIENG